MCELASGYDELCDSPGGVKKVYIFPVKDASGATTIDTYNVTAGEVTALTLVTGKQAFTFNVEVETATFTDSSVGEKAARSVGYTHTSTIVLHGNTAANIVAAENLIKGRHAIIHQLEDGTYELLHMVNGAKCQRERTPGTLYEDMNGSTLTFTSKEVTPAYKLDASIIATITVPQP